MYYNVDGFPPPATSPPLELQDSDPQYVTVSTHGNPPNNTASHTGPVNGDIYAVSSKCANGAVANDNDYVILMDNNLYSQGGNGDDADDDLMFVDNDVYSTG